MGILNQSILYTQLGINILDYSSILSGKIERGEIEYDDQLKFINGDNAKVHIVGTNSNYIFYLEKIILPFK